VILPFDNILAPVRVTVGPGRLLYRDDDNELVATAAANGIIAIAGRSSYAPDPRYEVNSMVVLHNASLEEYPRRNPGTPSPPRSR
jgi:hypothetical protein